MKIIATALLLLGVLPSISPVAATDGVEGGLVEGRRALAGPDRYATAVLLAANAISSEEAGTTEAVVVSGESLVDALSAASMAAAKSSVVLLTQTSSLPDVVRDFIVERGFASITIVGGPAAVSPEVADQLADLSSVNSVSRVEGADRYATSAQVAAAGTPGRWCGDGQATVVVVSGESLIDGVLAAPVAYAMGLPVLYTRSDGLPDPVRSYMASTLVGQAVVVGSEAEVGAGVISQLTAASVSVKRIDGADAPRRSVALVEALDDCGDAFNVAGDGYALVDVTVPVDGVTAAAALASGLNAPGRQGQLVPLLAVSGQLSTVVRSHLSDIELKDDSVGATVWALGGTARVTLEVMTAALEAIEYEVGPTTTTSIASSSSPRPSSNTSANRNSSTNGVTSRSRTSSRRSTTQRSATQRTCRAPTNVPTPPLHTSTSQAETATTTSVITTTTTTTTTTLPEISHVTFETIYDALLPLVEKVDELADRFATGSLAYCYKDITLFNSYPSQGIYSIFNGRQTWSSCYATSRQYWDARKTFHRTRSRFNFTLPGTSCNTASSADNSVVSSIERLQQIGSQVSNNRWSLAGGRTRGTLTAQHARDIDSTLKWLDDAHDIAEASVARCWDEVYRP